MLLDIFNGENMHYALKVPVEQADQVNASLNFTTHNSFYKIVSK